MWLTVAEGERHNGTAGTGARIKIEPGSGVFKQLVTTNVSYTKVEWLELDGTHTQGYTYGIGVNYPANYPKLTHLIVHDMTYSGISINDYVSGALIENSLVYNVHQLAGDLQTGAIQTTGPASQDTIHILNTTIYGCVTRAGVGCRHTDSWIVDARNVMSLGNYAGDFAANVNYSGTSCTNLSSDNSAPGTSSLLNKTASAQFVSLAGKDFHLANASDAANVGTNLSAYFTDDIDGVTRTGMGAWDIGADELPCQYYTRAFKSGTNEYSVGALAPVNASVSNITGNGPWTVYFNDSPNLSRIFINDCFTDGSCAQHKWKVTAVNNTAKTVTVTNSEYGETNAAPSPDNIHQTTVGRWYGTLQAWEDARQGDLVADTRLEKGVCSNDGKFTLANTFTIAASKTNSSYYMWLTVAAGERHNGWAWTSTAKTTYSGCAAELGANYISAFSITDSFTVIDGFIINGKSYEYGYSGITMSGAGHKCTVKNCVIFNFNGSTTRTGINFNYVNNGKAHNNIVYNCDWGIKVGFTNEAYLYNNTVVDCDFAGFRAQYTNYSDGVLKNNIACHNGTNGDYVANTGTAFNSVNYCLSSDATANNWGGTGNRVSQSLTFKDYANDDFRLAAVDAAAINYGDSTGLSQYFTTDIKDTIRHYGAWDIGADEFPCPSYTQTFKSGANVYNIGTLTALNVTVSNITGTGPWTVAFSGSPDLSRIFANDRFKDGGCGELKWMVTTVDNTAKTITVANSEYSETNAVPSPENINQATVGRWYNTLQAWENARQGDLVADNRLEKGVCYKDGIFTSGLTIDGSTTDATHYLWLTVAADERHNGIAGTGVVVNPSASTGAIAIADPYSVVEWLEVTDWGGSGNNNVAIGAGTGSANSTIRYCIVHDEYENNGGTAISSNQVGSKVYRNLIYETGTATVHFGIAGTGWGNMSVVSNTIYNTGTGLYRDNDGAFGPFYDNIVMGCATANFTNMTSATGGYFLTNDTTAPGTGNLTGKTAANQFVSLTGTYDLHLKAWADAINHGYNAGAPYNADIDSVAISGAWDIGADQYIDTMPPGINVTGLVNGYWYNTARTPDITVTDDKDPAPAFTAILNRVTTLQAGDSIDVQGYDTLVITAHDCKGNTATTTIAFKMDFVAPLAWSTPTGGTHSAGFFNNADSTITLHASDSLSGISHIFYTLDGTAPSDASSVYQTPLANIPQGMTLKFYARDNAGNAGDVVTELFAVDTSGTQVNAYNIGKKPDVTVTVDTVKACGAGWTVVFDNNPDLSRIFINDRFTDGASPQLKWKIAAVFPEGDSIRVVNSEANNAVPSAAHENTATIGRWFNSMQAWEDARQGNLVTGNRIEKGVCYNDSVFTSSVTISGSTTDASHYMWLTVAEGERHNGTAGTGARICINPGSGVFKQLVSTSNSYTRVEWLELDGTHTQGYTYGISVGYPANYPRINHLIVHDMSYFGIAITDYVSGARIENSLVYNVQKLAGDLQTGGIETMGPASMDTVHIFNTTIYGTVTRSGIGCSQPQNWVVDARNVVSMGNYGSDFASGVNYPALCVTNLSSDNSAPGTGSLVNKTASVQFVSLVGKDFHLADGSDAVNVGTSLSAYFTDDIDGVTRSGTWDVGADER
ncbi:MAG: chitobiase/beta-hexosaminidase C-terminal domain-containing protein [Fibrobacterota bacterium]